LTDTIRLKYFLPRNALKTFTVAHREFPGRGVVERPPIRIVLIIVVTPHDDLACSVVDRTWESVVDEDPRAVVP